MPVLLDVQADPREIATLLRFSCKDKLSIPLKLTLKFPGSLSSISPLTTTSGKL
jgi:hypothetical protein